MLSPNQIESLRESFRCALARDVSGLNIRYDDTCYYIRDAAGTYLCCTDDIKEMAELIKLESQGGFGTVEALLKPSPTLGDIGL